MFLKLETGFQRPLQLSIRRTIQAGVSTHAHRPKLYKFITSNRARFLYVLAHFEYCHHHDSDISCISQYLQQAYTSKNTQRNIYFFQNENVRT